MNDLRRYIVQNCKDFYANDIPNGNIASYIRALTAKLLWAIFLYSLVAGLIPINDFFAQNAIILIILALAMFFWGVIKDHLPSVFDECLTGKIFFKINNVKELNRYILYLMVLNIFSVFGLPKLLKLYKK